MRAVASNKLRDDTGRDTTFDTCDTRGTRAGRHSAREKEGKASKTLPPPVEREGSAASDRNIIVQKEPRILLKMLRTSWSCADILA